MIAISYRREDSKPVAGRLYDRLQAEFGKGNVFMDFDSIPYGVDFREHIKQMIDRSKLVIAMIGPDWFGQRRGRTRRIDHPADFVHLEIGYALQRGVPVIPVLIDNTRMPKAEDLPKDIEGLAFRNALTLDTGIDFHHHTDRLIGGIHGLVSIPGASITPAYQHNKRPSDLQRRRKIILGSASLLLVVVAATATWLLAAHARKQVANKSKQALISDQPGRLEAAAPLPAQSPQASTTTLASPSAPSPAPSASEAPITTQPASMPAGVTSPPARNNGSWRTWIDEFVRQFVQSTDSPDVDLASSFYAPNVDLFEEGSKNLNSIRREIETYNERWPLRRNNIRGDVQLKEKVPDREYSASFQQDYYVENSVRRDWIRGAVAIDLKIAVIDGVPKVFSIKQKVLHREKGRR